jgi:flagellin-like protein
MEERKIMKKFLKSKKALSPVVAAIILIAVTVAVSIAVAAWMGSMTTDSMEISELTITDLAFTIGESGNITVYVTNSGTSASTVTRIRVNGENVSNWSFGTSNTVTPGNSEQFTIEQAVFVGSKYAVSLYDVGGTMIGAYTAIA